MILVLGINYKTASVALRERIFFPIQQVKEVFTQLTQFLSVAGVVVLSTCHRTELYLQLKEGVVRENSSGVCALQAIIDWWCHSQQIVRHEFVPHLYWYIGHTAVCHLIRLASGLDSLLVGETPILGQVKRAYLQAQQHQTLSDQLHRLFQKAISSAKQIRHMTQLGQHVVTIEWAVFQIARSFLPTWPACSVLLLGTGEVAKRMAHALHRQGVVELAIASRHLTRAQQLAQPLGAQAIDLSIVTEQLASVDLVISATASPSFLITQQMAQQALSASDSRARVFIDLAVPRDIEPAVGHLSCVRLLHLDDLQGVVQQRVAAQEEALLHAEQLSQQMSDEFMRWLWEKEAQPTLCYFRSQAEEVRQRWHSWALNALREGEEAEQVVYQMAYKLTQQLIHLPTKVLQRCVLSSQSTMAPPPTKQYFESDKT